MLQPRRHRVGLGVVAGGPGQVRRREQLHRHRRELGRLRAGMSLPDERPRVRGEGVEAVPRFVQQRGDILGNAGGIHEHERAAPGVQRVAVAAGRLPGPRLEIEQSFGHHGAELAAKFGIDRGKDPRGGALQLGHIVVRYGRSGPPGIDAQVPGPEVVEPHAPTAVLQCTKAGRHHLRLDGVVQPFAVGGRVVEAALRGEDVVPVVGEVGIARHGLPQLHQPVEQRGKLVVRRHIRQVPSAPCGFAHAAVVALEKGREARQRHPFAAPLGRHRARDLLVLRREPFRLGHQRHVRFAKDLDRGPEPLERGLQVGAVGADRDEPFRQRHLGFLELRHHFGGEPQVNGLLRFVSGVAGVPDHRQRRGLGHELVESRPARQPGLQRPRVERRELQLAIERRERFPRRVGKAGAGVRQRDHGHRGMITL